MYTDKQNRNNFIFKTRRRIDDRSFQVQLALFPREIRRFRGLVTEDKSVAFGKSRGARARERSSLNSPKAVACQRLTRIQN